MSIRNYKFSDTLSAVHGSNILPKIQHLNILFNMHAAKLKLIMFQKYFFRFDFAENSELLICLIRFYLNKITYFNICCYHAVINIGNDLHWESIKNLNCFTICAVCLFFTFHSAWTVKID